MVQEFQVLRCFSCHIFQVHQVKKSKVWKCKLCGEKQSLLKVYGQGSGADCRRHVQKLNLLQGEVDQAAGSAAGQSWEHESSESNNDDDDDAQQRLEVSQPSQGSASMSRWNKYLEEKSDSAYTEEEGSLMYPGDDQSSPPPSHRKRKNHISHDCDVNEQKIKGNSAKLPKTNKTLEDCSVSVTGASQPGCIRAEDTGSSICHRKPAFPVVLDSSSVSTWDKFLPISNTEEERFSSAAGFHKCDPGLDPLHKMTPDMKDTCLVMTSGTMEPEALPKHVISTPAHETGMQISDQQTDVTPKAAATGALSKPLTLFHTEEDFDENY